MKQVKSVVLEPAIFLNVIPFTERRTRFLVDARIKNFLIDTVPIKRFVDAEIKELVP